MAARQLLLGLCLGVALTVAGTVPAAMGDEMCTKEQILAGTCNVASVINPRLDAVDLVGEIHRADLTDESGDVQDVGNPDDGESIDGWDDSAPPRPDDCSPEVRETCAGDPTVEPEPEPAPEVPGAVVVTMRDIASFRPAKPGNGMEPGGWAIEDLAANFVAAASVEVVSGTLLGQPAEVRFTPLGYRWSHSDGAVVESSQPGVTWEVLGVREFSPTGTSHAYAESGEYTVALEVVLGAEYRFAGSGWRTIAGTLTVAGDPQRVLVGQFDTVLTQGDCNAFPNGPGC